MQYLVEDEVQLTNFCGLVELFLESTRVVLDTSELGREQRVSASVIDPRLVTGSNSVHRRV